MNYEARELKGKGEKNNRWKGSSASYTSKHQFLKRNYGNPKNCDHCGVEGKKEEGGRWSVHFALIKGRSYSHNRSDYLGLCRTCHGRYDWNEKKTENMIKAARLTKGLKSSAKSLIAKNKKRDLYGHYIKTTT